MVTGKIIDHVSAGLGKQQTEHKLHYSNTCLKSSLNLSTVSSSRKSGIYYLSWQLRVLIPRFVKRIT